MRNKMGLFGVALILSLMSTEAASAGRLAGEELRKTFSGKTFKISTPIGALAVHFQPNGAMRGRAQAAVSAFGEPPREERDTGKWQVRGEELCQRWQTWLSGTTFCVRITKSGDKFRWSTAEGYSGEARVLR